MSINPSIVFLMLLFSTSMWPDALTSRNQWEKAEPLVQSDDLRVMTFNIRYNTASDGVHAWPNRRDRVASLVDFYDPDLLGVQEALKDQVDDLSARLPQYDFIGVGRDDGENAGEFSGIFFNKERLELITHDTFWLSETPEIPGSKGWDAALPRIVTWGQFRDKTTGTVFYHFNTHFDHRGEQARIESARLLASRVDSIAGTTPAIVTGDFNFEPTSEGYSVLTKALEDTYTQSGGARFGPEGTFTGFTVTDQVGPRIDYIFVQNGPEVVRHGTLSNQWEGSYPSDHLPVLADLSLE